MIAHLNRYESPLAAKAEQIAYQAYAAAHLDPAGEDGTADLLVALMGHPTAIEFTEGVPPGRALLEHGSEWRPVCALVAPGQRPEQLTMACARAAAALMAAARMETWDEAELEATALAIAMPERPFTALLRDEGLAEAAEWFCVDEADAARRARMLRGSRTSSGERPAMRIAR